MSRVALVTGAARGIGAATVRALARDGYQVVAVDSCAGSQRPAGVDYDLATRADLAAVADGLGDQVIARVADVRGRENLAVAVAASIERWGRLDAVVAGAAVIAGGLPLWDSPDAHLDTQWQIDVRGVWNTAAVTVPHLLASPDPSAARFVAVSSAAGTQGLFHLAAYSAAKHAVVGLVKGLAADLVGTGVTACAVAPGSTDTQMLSATAALYDLPDVADFADGQAVRRLLTADEVATTIAFCCSPAGAVLNGSVVAADGGFGT